MLRLIAQQPVDHDRNSHQTSTTSDSIHEHHPLVTPFIHPASTSSMSTANTNQSQASGINVSKVFGGMGSTIDRSAFRQQPPPMKVKICYI